MLIGEVSRRSGVSSRMLRHYDTLGLVCPTGRTSGGYREYSADDVRRLFHVESLRALGLSLQEVGRALDEPGFAPADLVGDLVRHTRDRIAAEQELLATLQRVDASAPADWDDVLHVVAQLRALDSESAAHRQQAALAPDAHTALSAAALVEAVLTEDDLNVAGALRWLLARTGGPVPAELSTALHSGSVDVRRRAVAAIASVRTAEASAALRRALDDTDTMVRERAALTLASRGVVDAAPELVEMIVDGRRDVEAAEALGLLVGDPSVGLLLDRVDTAVDAAVRGRITQALAEIPGETARAALERMTGDADRTVAATAAAILAIRENPAMR
ncbi:MerR family transcriptional regulator [Prescottella subtropica]|uniref:MerR family transcriptional regulator n=1 Tax=Prescottella subtropica TaxID=2545757 RepID=UPI0010FA27AA|nr:MerR family transcriptional regulator [Prescottella subtropica]